MKALLIIFIYFLLTHTNVIAQQHQITFCGELVPMDANTSEKLAHIIKTQIPVARLTDLRRKTNKYFGWLEQQLKNANLPVDLKYLPIVESQFKSEARSQVAAAGLWQIMPETGRGYNMIVSAENDERLDPQKSTIVAMKILRDYYKITGKHSWALTCAAYNWGPGNILKAMRSQGLNYYNMNLNHETATYVYKIIATKELWEHPELYMKGFNKNLFSQEALAESDKNKGKVNVRTIKTDQGDIEVEEMEDIIDPTDTVTIIPMDYERIIYEDDDEQKIPEKKLESKIINNKVKEIATIEYTEVEATIVKKSNNFKDGDLIAIRLDENVTYANGDKKEKGYIFKTDAWLIDDRLKVNINKGVLLYCEGEEGIPKTLMKNNEINVILKIPKQK
jgi:membrane-bound lytic murein transglycosylase D